MVVIMAMQAGYSKLTFCIALGPVYYFEKLKISTYNLQETSEVWFRKIISPIYSLFKWVGVINLTM